MNKVTNGLSILILAVAMIWVQACFSQQLGPEEVYQQYRVILSTSDDFDALAGLLSSRTLESSRQYIEKMKSRGIAEAEAKSALFGGRRRIFKYEKSRKLVDFHMNTPLLSPATEKRIGLLFSPHERELVRTLLVDKCGNNLPGHENAGAEELDRIRFAALKLSEGDLAKLEKVLRLAGTDWRDLLMAAGFGDDSTAHLRW